MNVLIADDESLAREWLRTLLAEVEGTRVVGEARDGAETVAMANELDPDLIFLDIEMPVLNGLQVVERLNGDPAVVFTTAFDHYALRAFDLHAVDYLLKPFERGRFLSSLERATRFGENRGGVPLVQRVKAVGATSDYLSRLFVRLGTRIVPVDVGRILLVNARRDCVAVVTEVEEHILSTSLTGFLQHLNPSHFVRVHRSHAVNVHHIIEVRPTSNGRMEIEMPGGVVVPVSRGYAAAIRRMVY